MTRALAALLTHSIDYAGVFPPAKLDLETAYAEYIRYRSGPEAWILDKFALRSSQLSELSGLLASHKPSTQLDIAVIGRSGLDRAEWEAGLAADAVDLNAFQEAASSLAQVVAYEVRLPSNAKAVEWIADLGGFDGVDVYVELPWGADQADALAAAVESDFVYVKARCGGETAAAFPDSAALAGFIQGAVHLGVPFKLTAGLHHAGPYCDKALGVRMHGFLNAYAATAFAVGHDLTVRELATVLDCNDAAAFALTDEGLSGLGWTVDMDTLEEAREFFVGFGSCSIEEPLDTLRAAGHLIN